MAELSRRAVRWRTAVTRRCDGGGTCVGGGGIRSTHEKKANNNETIAEAADSQCARRVIRARRYRAYVFYAGLKIRINLLAQVQ